MHIGSGDPATPGCFQSSKTISRLNCSGQKTAKQPDSVLARSAEPRYDRI